jgi:hypothetical protein
VLEPIVFVSVEFPDIELVSVLELEEFVSVEFPGPVDVSVEV